jgi:general secretion pathway protein E
MIQNVFTELVEKGVLNEKDLADALKLVDITGDSLDTVLRSKGYLAENVLLEYLASVLGMELVIDLSQVSVPQDFIRDVPLQFARNTSICALGKLDGCFRVATSAPLDTHTLDQVEAMLGAEVVPVLAPRAEITSLVNRAYTGGKEAEDMGVMLEGMDEAEILSDIQKLDETEDVLDIANKPPIIKLVNSILFETLKMRASDVHFQPYEDKLLVRHRIDGILYDFKTIPKKVQEAVISRIKVMGRMDIAERRMPQDGRATVHMGDREVDIRISSVPTKDGERIVMRLLDKSARLYELHELGLDNRKLPLLEKLISQSHGIIFVTGPTGSGKTTTLYACLKKLNSKENNIITIEDPIEYNLSDISQIQVSTKKGLTFAEGLRSLVRQDPDIMMVGEVRDEETARIATQSALTGHLVFSTLHTNDAPGAVARMLHFDIEPYLIASSLLAVIAQRLVRLVCERCKEQVNIPSEKLAEIGLTKEKVAGKPIFRGRGCPHCMGTGYLERTAIYEMLPINDFIRDMIIRRCSSTEIKAQAVKDGMETLRMDGAKKVIEGITTVEEVLRVTQMDVF